MNESFPIRRIYPQRLQNAFMQVGEPDAEFRPSPANLVVRVVLGLSIAVAGFGVCVLGFLDTDDLGECLIGGLGLIAVGLLMTWAMGAIWGQRLMVCPGGLVRKRGLKVKACPWKEIRSIEETEGKTEVKIILEHGERWDLDSNHTPAIDDLVRRLRELSKQHGITWSMKKGKKE